MINWLVQMSISTIDYSQRSDTKIAAELNEKPKRIQEQAITK